MRFLVLSALACLASQTAALVLPSYDLGTFKIIEHPDPAKRQLLQNIVTWDNASLFIRGERIMLFSGEFHPFRCAIFAILKSPSGSKVITINAYTE